MSSRSSLVEELIPLTGFEQDSPTEKVHLQRHIGLISACTFIVGSIVGSGIFVTPVGVLRYAGSVGSALVIWGITGILAAIGALCYSELGSTFPQSGSNFTYIRLFYGELPAFMYLWVRAMITGPVDNAIASLTFASYVLEPVFSSCAVPEAGIKMIAVFVICLLTYINCHNVTWATRVQDVFTFAKILALIIIIITGAIYLFSGHMENFENAFEGTTRQPGFIVLAFYSSWFTYAGWTALNAFLEEVKDPIKNLPRAVYISLPLVTAVYVLSNIAYLAVLSPEEMLSSNAVAVTFADRMLGRMSWIIPFSVALSIFGRLNAHVFASSRLYFVGAREGYLPHFLSMVNINKNTPVPSLFFQCMLCLAYLSSAEVYDLINYTTFTGILSDGLSVAGLVWMRFRQPDLDRPIKFPLFLPLTFVTICLVLIALPCYTEPAETVIGVAILLTGIPVYAATIYWKDGSESYKKAVHEVTILVQKVFLCLPEEKEK